MTDSVSTSDDLRDHLIDHAENTGKESIESTNVVDASTKNTILNDPKESSLSTEQYESHSSILREMIGTSLSSRSDLGNSEYSDETVGRGETDISDETVPAETFVPRGKITLLTTASKPTKGDKSNRRS